jgi:hypothetical protein
MLDAPSLSMIEDRFSQWSENLGFSRSGLGLTPITWQGVCVTLLMMLVVFATIGVIVAFVRDPNLGITGAELAVFISFTYRHARRMRE